MPLLLSDMVIFSTLVPSPPPAAISAPRHDEGLGVSPRARGSGGRLAHALLFFRVAQAYGGWSRLIVDQLIQAQQIQTSVDIEGGWVVYSRQTGDWRRFGYTNVSGSIKNVSYES